MSNENRHEPVRPVDVLNNIARQKIKQAMSLDQDVRKHRDQADAMEADAAALRTEAEADHRAAEILEIFDKQQLSARLDHSNTGCEAAPEVVTRVAIEEPARTPIDLALDEIFSRIQNLECRISQSPSRRS